jgi:hypothetical protein
MYNQIWAVVGIAVGVKLMMGCGWHCMVLHHPKSTIYSILHDQKSCKIKYGLWLALQLVWPLMSSSHPLKTIFNIT